VRTLCVVVELLGRASVRIDSIISKNVNKINDVPGQDIYDGCGVPQLNVLGTRLSVESVARSVWIAA
jgi:hypothetical protein